MTSKDSSPRFGVLFPKMPRSASLRRVCLETLSIPILDGAKGSRFETGLFSEHRSLRTPAPGVSNKKKGRIFWYVFQIRSELVERNVDCAFDCLLGKSIVIAHIDD